MIIANDVTVLREYHLVQQMMMVHTLPRIVQDTPVSSQQSHDILHNRVVDVVANSRRSCVDDSGSGGDGTDTAHRCQPRRSMVMVVLQSLAPQHNQPLI